MLRNSVLKTSVRPADTSGMSSIRDLLNQRESGSAGRDPDHPLAPERGLRWTLGSRRLRVDCTAGAVLGVIAVATGSMIAGLILVAVCAPLAAWSSSAAVDPEVVESYERARETERLLATLEPELASVLKERLGHEPAAAQQPAGAAAVDAAPAVTEHPVAAPVPVRADAPPRTHAGTHVPVAWDTGRSVAPPA
jgi:hypothetical protein